MKVLAGALGKSVYRAQGLFPPVSTPTQTGPSVRVFVLYVDLVFDVSYPVVVIVGYSSKVVVNLCPTYSKNPNNRKPPDHQLVGCLLSFILTY